MRPPQRLEQRGRVFACLLQEGGHEGYGKRVAPAESVTVISLLNAWFCSLKHRECWFNSPNVGSKSGGVGSVFGEILKQNNGIYVLRQLNQPNQHILHVYREIFRAEFFMRFLAVQQSARVVVRFERWGHAHVFNFGYEGFERKKRAPSEMMYTWVYTKSK